MTSPSRHIFRPFQQVVIPVIPGADSTITIELARQLGGKIHLVGLIRVAPESSISAEARTARQLRKRLQKTAQ